MSRADKVNDKLLKRPVITAKEIKVQYVTVQYAQILSEE